MNKLKELYIKYIKLPDLESEIVETEFYHPKSKKLSNLIEERDELTNKLNPEPIGEAISQ